jgi:hypothetical protein
LLKLPMQKPVNRTIIPIMTVIITNIIFCI